MEKRILLQELSEMLAAREKLTKKKAETFAKAFFEIIETGLDKDKFVKIKGFGTFKMVSVSERESVNVSTGERFQISGHTKISFTPDAELRDLINKPFAHFQTVILNEGTDTADFDKIDALHQEEEAVAEEAEVVEQTEKTENEQTVPITKAENIVATPLQPTKEEKVEAEQEELNETQTFPEASTEDTESAEAPVEEPTTLPTPSFEEIAQQEETLSEETTEVNTAEALAPTPEEVSTTQEEASEEALAGNEEAIPEPSTADNDMEEAKSSITAQPSETNWWKVAALTLLVALLMVISYFTGYFRVFGSCSTPFPTTEVATDSLAADSLNANSNDSITLAQPEDTINQPDHLPSVDRAQPTAPVSPRVASPAPISKKPVQAAPMPHPEATPAPTPEASPAPVQEVATPKETYSQVPGGKYRIVGTKRSHTLQTGETLRTLALNEYGSKGYAPYIIRHNHLSNPDRVQAGAVIRLPELELAQ